VIPGVRLRPAREDDLATCAEIWRAGLDDYGLRVGRAPTTAAPQALGGLLAHLRSTDPERFLVAERPSSPILEGSPVVGYVAASRRGATWFLAMLFVHPAAQARGLGRTLLEAVLPDGETAARATCTDSAQPISNALYARYGIVPRLPVLELVGHPAPASLPSLPEGVRAVPFELLTAASPDEPGPRRLAAGLAALDRELLGYAHPQDHAYLAGAGRLGYLYEVGDGQVVGYGYTSASGRLGPVAVRDEVLFPGVLGHLLGALAPGGAGGPGDAVAPGGAVSTWVPGAAGRAVTALLGAGLRIEDFPALLCWDRPFADLSRYVPISLAVL
jgi:GNAT superfamily N-acetyltransferase